jgi:imidazolonepropionase-like amidohydrolase
MRVFFTKRMDGKATLVSTNVLGGRERAHASSKMAQSYHISPDGQMIAFRENYNLYVMPALKGPQNLAAEKSGNALPVSKVSYGGATYPSWTTDNQLNWTLGPTLFSVDAKDAMADDFEPLQNGLSLSYKVKADKPSGMIALTNARIITMSDDKGGVIENGTILIDGDRIKAIGSDIDLNSSIKTVDMDGKTIVPGFIEAHYHGPQGTDELIPQQNWKTLATLALGVTTVFDPSNRATEIFAAAEMQRAGKLLSPRTYSTGEVVYGAKAPGFFADIQKEEDAQEHIGRLKNQGAHGIKNYNQPRRDQRQQVVKASHDNNILVVSEGGSLYHMDMSLVQDGNSSVEHNLPVSAIYDDVVQMFAQTNVANTPTLSVTYGGVRGEDYYYQESDVWKHPILSKHVPPAVLQARAVRRQMAPEEDYADADAGAVSKKLMEAGVMVSIGGHGQL